MLELYDIVKSQRVKNDGRSYSTECMLSWFTVYSENIHQHSVGWLTHTQPFNRFTAGLEYVRVHPGQQVPER